MEREERKVEEEKDGEKLCGGGGVEEESGVRSYDRSLE
jgi:hypothetical protein